MQMTLDFGAGEEIAWVRDQLKGSFGDFDLLPPREPVGQLVKSLISSLTLDAVSARAFDRLVRAFPQWDDLAAAEVDEIQTVIADVTNPEGKAKHLSQTIRRIAAQHPDFDLGFLGRQPVEEALAWLQKLDGVGPKVAASTLNFSTLNRSAFVIDTHVLRVLRQFGLVGSHADTQRAFDSVMAATMEWTPEAFADLHVLIKRLGQTTCRPNQPHCERCPLRERCKYAGRTRHREDGASGKVSAG